jgi:hypothetical protein
MKETKKKTCVLYSFGWYLLGKVEVKPSKGSFRYYVITLGVKGGLQKYDN